MREQNPQMRGSWLANASEMGRQCRKGSARGRRIVAVYGESGPRAWHPLSETELRRAWAEVNDKLTSAFEGFTWEDWLQKPAAASDEDFIKDPMRNRLAVVMNRTSHASYHAGQAAFTK